MTKKVGDWPHYSPDESLGINIRVKSTAGEVVTYVIGQLLGPNDPRALDNTDWAAIASMVTEFSRTRCCVFRIKAKEAK